MAKRVITIFASDIHLSSKAPIWRSAEPNWFEAQKRVLKELEELKNKYECPIFCAGDIFDDWASDAELINFALEYMPQMFCIPGQHDLPNHNINEIGRSAYWTLVKAGKIVSTNNPIIVGKGMVVHGFPFGRRIKRPWDVGTHIAMIHQYNWIPKANYQKANPKKKITNNRKEFKGFDIVVCGDNHIPFECKIGKTLFWNCGSLMRRHSDEIKHRPRVGLLLEDGTMRSHKLKSYLADKYVTDNVKFTKEAEMDLTELATELQKLNEARFDFALAINLYKERYNIPTDVMNIILKSIGLVKL